MRRRKPLDLGLALPGQADLDASAVGSRGRTPHKLMADQPVAAADRAVVAQLQPLGQLADGYKVTPREPFDRQECLVLLRGEAVRPGGVPAEPLEAPQGETKFGEELVM